ncbi:hypothetical protein MTR67_039143 [Solanum verrucosum]|uniref:Uncharacterized protein n=1 Tax=Solanum verrucosum TaxID=315347 RepID=A0AAF0UGF1_SOLVR|nr:hypothetical protein MTR67_039143 [Solanum verrucosum]
MDYFESLSKYCKFEIISKTTPADTVKSMILSKGSNLLLNQMKFGEDFCPMIIKK